MGWARGAGPGTSPALARVVLLGAVAAVLSAWRSAAEQKPSYYEVLGVPKDADDKTIKQAYRKMALKWHPDKNPDDRETAENRFREVAEAYEVLSNPEQRKNYDLHGTAGSGSGGGGPGWGGGNPFSGFGFKDPNDLFKEMFGNEDPFADFSKFFDDIKFEDTSSSEKDMDQALAELEASVSRFYSDIGQPEKAQPEKVKEVLHMPKWRGKEHKMFKSLQAKYSDPPYAAALKKLERAFDKFRKKTNSVNNAEHNFGFDFGGMGNAFGGIGDFKNMFGGMNIGGSSSSFTFSSSTMSGGKTVKSETKIVNGKRVTKTIETDSRGTRATLEQEEGGRVKRQTGVKRAEQLGNNNHDEI